MRFLLGLALLMTTGAAPVLAEEKPANDKVVCKRTEEGNTGSRMLRWTKICRKKSEWAAQEDETQRALRDARDRGAPDPAAVLPQGGAAPRP